MLFTLLNLYAYLIVGAILLCLGWGALCIILTPFALLYAILAEFFASFIQGIKFLIEDIKDNVKKN